MSVSRNVDSHDSHALAALMSLSPQNLGRFALRETMLSSCLGSCQRRLLLGQKILRFGLFLLTCGASQQVYYSLIIISFSNIITQEEEMHAHNCILIINMDKHLGHGSHCCSTVDSPTQAGNSCTTLAFVAQMLVHDYNNSTYWIL